MTLKPVAQRLAFAWVIPIALLLLFVFWNPVGYVGGGADDARYLAAAKCWVESGPCLPTNHWEGRWPLVGSLAGSFSLFGINRFALALPALVASVVCLALLKHLGDQLFGRPVGLVAAILFGLLPVFSTQALSATVAPVELAFVLGCFSALRRPLLAGLLLGLAFQVRETSIAALPAIIFLLRSDRRALIAFGCGFLAPLAVEALFFHAMTGDFLYRRTLSVQHTQIASSALAKQNDGLPFFNRALLQNWEYEPGVRVHWLIDGPLNLFINLKTGFYFLLAPLLFRVHRSSLGSRERRSAELILVGALIYVAVLAYALSVQPNPRMMFPALAGMAMILGLITLRAFNLVTGGALALSVALSALCLAGQPRHLQWQRVAEGWARRYPMELAQKDYFAFSPALQALPGAGSGRPMLLTLRARPCAVRAAGPKLHSLAVVEQEGRDGLAALVGDRTTLCLYRYPAPSRAESRKQP